MAHEIDRLREWARTRTRPASHPRTAPAAEEGASEG